jgi:hypothetical protein
MTMIFDGTNGITFPAGGQANPSGNLISDGANLVVQSGGTLVMQTAGNAAVTIGTDQAVTMPGNLTVSSTGFMQMPVGNTAQRPGSPSDGFVRKNSTTGYVEYYDSAGTLWRDIDRSPQLYNFSGTITFSNCAQSGPFGPVLANAVSSYSSEPFQSTWLNNQDLFNVVAGVQFWRVPKNGTYTVRVAGARSGASTHGGLGRDLTSTFSLIQGLPRPTSALALCACWPWAAPSGLFFIRTRPLWMSWVSKAMTAGPPTVFMPRLAHPRP